MKFAKMSLIAAMLLGSSVYAFDNAGLSDTVPAKDKKAEIVYVEWS